jgi:hypothetical protein
MTRRQTLVSLAVIAAIAVAVPAIAQVDSYRAADNIKRIDNELRKLAHKANRKATKALKLARKAQIPGPTGPTGPGGAAGAGNTAFAQAPGAESTGDDTQYVQLPGGPAVTVNVPASGSIQVAASALIGEDAGAVALFEDGVPIDGQSDFCGDPATPGPLPPGPPLFVSADLAGSGFGAFTYGTPAVPSLIGSCSSTGAPSAVLFNTSPGTHTYELRYAYCGCDPPPAEATFSERKLWVTTLP